MHDSILALEKQSDRINEIWEKYESTRNTQEDMSIFRLKFYISEALVYGYDIGLADGKNQKRQHQEIT
jgi:hypothetical protein